MENDNIEDLFQTLTDEAPVASSSSLSLDINSEEHLLSTPPPMLLNVNKAGMEGLDKESINKIIYEASKGSLYFENERKKEAAIKVRIESQQKQLRQISPEQLEESLRKADELLESLERERDLSRVIVHIDMDAFFAAVELLSKPHLKEVPMAVGSNHMLSTSNYAARKFGVRAGMPGFIGKKLCPQLVIVPPNFSEYKKYSSLFGTVLSCYDPNFTSGGLDEAYLDITDCLDERIANAISLGSQSSQGDLADEVVREMRSRIFDVTNLTSSAGIAPNGMLAKVCSDMNKPNGQFRIDQSKEAIVSFIKELPIRKIPGIGKVSEQMLKSLGVHTCSQLIEKRAIIHRLHTPISFNSLMRVGLGVGYGRVERDSEKKSMSIERTFEDTGDVDELTSTCKYLCENLVDDLVKENLASKTITLKIKTHDFQVHTRAKTLSSYTQNLNTIYNAALSLLKSEIKVSKNKLKLRLMGVRASTFVGASEVPKATQKSIEELITIKKSAQNISNLSSSPIPQDSSLNTLEASSISSLPPSLSDVVWQQPVMKTLQISCDQQLPLSHVNEEPCFDSPFQAICPVCSRPFSDADEFLINAHIDECLSKEFMEKELGVVPNPCTDIVATQQKSPERSATIQSRGFQSVMKQIDLSPKKPLLPPAKLSPAKSRKRKPDFVDDEKVVTLKKYFQNI